MNGLIQVIKNFKCIRVCKKQKRLKEEGIFILEKRKLKRDRMAVAKRLKAGFVTFRAKKGQILCQEKLSWKATGCKSRLNYTKHRPFL